MKPIAQQPKIILSLLLMVTAFLAISQDFENGAYHVDTGEPIDESIWKDAIMGEIDLFSPERP